MKIDCGNAHGGVSKQNHTLDMDNSITNKFFAVFNYCRSIFDKHGEQEFCSLKCKNAMT